VKHGRARAVFVSTVFTSSKLTRRGRADRAYPTPDQIGERQPLSMADFQHPIDTRSADADGLAVSVAPRGVPRGLKISPPDCGLHTGHPVRLESAQGDRFAAHELVSKSLSSEQTSAFRGGGRRRHDRWGPHLENPW
jgi:hypothetical protein